MKNKEKLYILDEIGIGGTGGKGLSAFHKKKTGEAIRSLKTQKKQTAKKTISTPTR